MTASLEQRKQLYSKQLAAYTLRQWNTVRHQLNPSETGKPTNVCTGLATPPDTDKPDENEAPSVGDRGKARSTLGSSQNQRQNGSNRKGL
ncbi:hypothetical protein CVT24_004761 [Panaeolus cyanescens]|uniref:Uncharacterized protein n=1 Tax=Panaeolus cyanescens TaxID=181874 RepID=A0A409V9T6_9AGAR|nr:hypothetical protein CVT24_004761 [Panaeolus cyanescens]